MPVPYWIKDAIFYQIFPDRFANGDTRSDPANVHAWGAPPTSRSFFGGDLAGITQKFDYLLDLGVNAIYLNPIFQASSTHRYNASDYLQIDPKLGTLKDFRSLIEVAHRNNVRVVLDGVFNHCGRGFFAFADVLENQEESPYRDWFHIRHFPVDAYSPGDAHDYEGWWKHKSLPKFNTSNPAVRRYLLSVARYWIEQGADGWRLDVPNEIDDDAFWDEFRQTVLAANSEAYLLGEIWDGDRRWVNDTHFDGLMNYPVRDAILNYVNARAPASEFCAALERNNTLYARENVYAMYLLIGSHDTERVWTMCKGLLERVMLAFLIEFALPGAPSIYYGDEVGLPGGKDPDCRRCFPWETGLWNSELRNFTRHLTSLRKRMPVLRRGDYHKLLADDSRGVVAFARGLGEDHLAVVVNNSATKRVLRLPVAGIGWRDGRIIHNLLGEGDYIVSGDSLTVTVAPWTGLWLA